MLDYKGEESNPPKALKSVFRFRFSLVPMILVLVPVEGEIIGGAHQFLFMREMIFRTGDQPMQNLLNLE